MTAPSAVHQPYIPPTQAPAELTLRAHLDKLAEEGRLPPDA